MELAARCIAYPVPDLPITIGVTFQGTHEVSHRHIPSFWTHISHNWHNIQKWLAHPRDRERSWNLLSTLLWRLKGWEPIYPGLLVTFTFAGSGINIANRENATNLHRNSRWWGCPVWLALHAGWPEQQHQPSLPPISVKNILIMVMSISETFLYFSRFCDCCGLCVVHGAG